MIIYAAVKSLLLAASFLLALTGSAHAKSKKCPKVKGKPLVYGVGSSTMGISLGPMMARIFKGKNINFRKWGKASSGLARPDFHDWPKEIESVAKKYDPDFWVVSLGTNDYQSIRTKKKGWIKWGNKRWTEIYAERVDRMLKVLAGPNKRRMIVWMGPVAFVGKKAQVMAPVINRIMRERVEAFGGKAIFYDTHAKTLNKRGRPIAFFKAPGNKRRQKARTKDNIHLTRGAVRHLLALPVIDIIENCLK